MPKPLAPALRRACLLLLLATASPLSAQTGLPGLSPEKKTTPAPQAAPQQPELEQRLEEARRRLEALAAAPPESIALPPGIEREEAQQRRPLLEQLVSHYQQHLRALEDLAETRRARRELAREAEDWTGFEQAKPYPIELVDTLRDELHATRLEADTLRLRASNQRQQLESAQNALAESQKRTRKLYEEAESQDNTLRGAAEWRIELEQLRQRTRSAEIGMLQTRLRLTEEQVARLEKLATFLERKKDIAEAGAPFGREDLEEKLKALAQRRQELESELRKALEEERRARERLDATRQELALSRAGDNPESTQTADLERRLELRKVEADTAALRSSLLESFLEVNRSRSEIWQNRYDVMDLAEPARIDEALARSREDLEKIRGWKPYLNSNLDLTRSLIQNNRQALEGNNLGQADRALLERELRSYVERESIYRDLLAEVADLEQFLVRWREELLERRGALPTLEKAEALVKRLSALVAWAWDYEVFTVTETITVEGEEIERRRGVTVRKIVHMLLILVLGAIACRFLSRWVQALLIRRFNVERHMAMPIAKGVFYLSLFLVLLLSLTMVRIPLTIFAFFGGALAIGVGFGAQNLINNFISGLILLLERPLKVGDIVEVDGLRGRVTNIGARCSQVKRFDGIDLLVPNSVFLEKNVINWTLSDQVLRFDVVVGVAYGSPTREVSQLIHKAVSEHGKVLREPEPVVIFEDFGDSALIFRAFFWLEIQRMMDYRRVANDLRHRIDRLFREANIVIAFPQRDVHLDSIGPVRVELARAARQTSPQAPGEPEPETPRQKEIEKKKKNLEQKKAAQSPPPTDPGGPSAGGDAE